MHSVMGLVIHIMHDDTQKRKQILRCNPVMRKQKHIAAAGFIIRTNTETHSCKINSILTTLM